jgi:hypothetical protein
MLFTINFDQTRKMKQEEAAKDNALAEASAMTKTEAANLAWAKEGQISSPVCKGIIWVRLVFFMFVDVHMANMDALFFRDLLLYLFFLCICCSWLPGP